MSQYLHIVYIKSITQKNYFYFFFVILLTCKNAATFWDTTLLLLILHLSSFKCFAFFKFNMPSQQSDNKSL